MIEREEFLFGIEEKFLAATELVDYGDYPEAKIVLQEILDHEPAYARAHYDLARIYFKGLHDLNRALYHIRLCCASEPEFAPAYYLYLDILLKKKDFKAAEAVFKKALEISSVCKACIYNKKAYVEEASGNFALAERFYREAFMNAIDCCDDDLDKHIARLKKKQQLNARFVYNR